MERLLLVAALLVFIVATWSSWRNLPEVDTGVNWWLLGLAAAMVPITLAVNAVEFVVAARLLGMQVRAGAALHVSVLSTAANVLPIPGAVVVKTRALRQRDETYRNSFSMVTAIGVMWVAVALLCAGLLQLLQGNASVALLALAAGGAAATSAAGLLAMTLPRGRVLRACLPIAVVETVSVVFSTLRIWLLIAALGYPSSAADAAALTVAAIVANAIGLFPAGLGIREVLSAGISGLVGLDPAVGLIVAAADRVLVFAVMGMVGLLMLVTGTWKRALASPTPAESGVEGTEPEVSS